VKPKPKPACPPAEHSVREEQADEQLVAAALQGEREAFQVLVRRHQRALVSHLYRHTGQRDGALDLAQEVFLKVYLSLSSFDFRYRFTTWLYRIASNCVIDHLRKKRPRTCPLQGDTDGNGRDAQDRGLAGSDPTPHEILRMRELQARLEDAVRSLPVDYRQLILLRHRQHCRYDEIARITQLPIGTVKNRIFRAREILRHELADMLDTEDGHG
jgi:RNA polymerase sigma-70 factor (ECF subfamily)